MRLFQSLPSRAVEFYQDLLLFPWKNTALTLRERFREDRLGLTASSLTFTTTIALVPLITVALAVFSAFPMFAKFQDVLQKWLVDSLIPDNIARQVLGYLTQFAGKASRLGVAGVAVLFTTALALILTIDRTLNNIWRVRRPRALAQRVLVYWAGMTLGPLLLGASLTMTSYAISASRGLVGVVPGGIGVLLDFLQFGLLAAGAAAFAAAAAARLARSTCPDTSQTAKPPTRHRCRVRTNRRTKPDRPSSRTPEPLPRCKRDTEHEYAVAGVHPPPR